jgi:protein-S-isoprenylcysteine O-methyltransferase Ste14
MQLPHFIQWVNVAILIVSLTMFAVLYIYSLIPTIIAKTQGEKAWKLCKYLRMLATLFMIIALINIFLWLWLAIPILAWPINPNPWVGIIIGALILMVMLPIWLKGVQDSGIECYAPSKESKMFGGIYHYIRHPQTLGEMSWFIAFPLFVNSLFLLGVCIIFLFIYIPIMIRVEEQDLIRRYGDAYREYQRQTGALFPKFKKPED